MTNHCNCRNFAPLDAAPEEPQRPEPVKEDPEVARLRSLVEAREKQILDMCMKEKAKHHCARCGKELSKPTGKDVPNNFLCESCFGAMHTEYTQRPDPGEGWRLLGAGEVTKTGDEDFYEGLWIGTRPSIAVTSNAGLFRRRVEPVKCSCDMDTATCGAHQNLANPSRVEPVAQYAQNCPLCGSEAWNDYDCGYTCCKNNTCGLAQCWIERAVWNRLALREVK